ncbi:MAG: nucleoid-associated protein [Chitinophagaceae bacterium]|nr:MAG: nucleoid-associated protein [Chitinophagaceae bacterium]
MIFSTEATLQQLSIHKVGNKGAAEPLTLSEQPYTLDDEVLSGILRQYFASGFEKIHEIYRLSHPTGNLGLNEVFHYCKTIFEDPANFHENSRQLAKQLYDIADHPNIKPGEFYVALFHNIQVEGVLTDAVGLFKSENKETYLKVTPAAGAFGLSYEEEAINIKKLDKGCLVFNVEQEQGYKVAVIDHTNKSGEAVYWMDDFLKLQARNDEYNQTHNVLSIYKNFITDKLDEKLEVSKPDKIDLLNRSIRYFKENDQFNLDEFSNVVLDNPVAIQEWKDYKKHYETESGNEIGDSFSISDAAVKKQARTYKSVLKLDKNFHIYIHGNRDLIEKGFDESVKMHYYKVYFSEEQ